MIFRETLRVLRASLDVNNLPLLIFVNKGIEVGTNALTLEIIADTCGVDIAKAATFIVRFFQSHSVSRLTAVYSQGHPSRKKVGHSLNSSLSSSSDLIAVVQRQPTSVSVASFTELEAVKASALFHQPHFRWYGFDIIII